MNESDNLGMCSVHASALWIVGWLPGRGSAYDSTHSQYVTEYTSRTSNTSGTMDQQQAELCQTISRSDGVV